jgi:hypothetical protein
MKLLLHLSNNTFDIYFLLTTKFSFIYYCSYVCDNAEYVGQAKANNFHRHGKCYKCGGLFFFEQLADSRKNGIDLPCMVEYFDNQLCGEYRFGDPGCCGLVGTFCFECEITFLAIIVLSQMSLWTATIVKFICADKTRAYVIGSVTCANWRIATAVSMAMHHKCVPYVRPLPSVKIVFLSLMNVLVAVIRWHSITTPCKWHREHVLVS